MVIDYIRLEQLLDYHFSRHDTALQALTHPSYDHERSKSGAGNYQRLEFLGDAVLGMLLAEWLYNIFPDSNEGELSRFRARTVDQGTLAGVARRIGLGEFIRLGRGEVLSAGQDKDSILADVLESLIAAVYLDGGLEAARHVVLGLFRDILNNFGNNKASLNDAKSELQEQLSARGLPSPEYRLVEESGSPHARIFRFAVSIGDTIVVEGEGRTKKAAQTAAAMMALEKMISESL